MELMSPNCSCVVYERTIAKVKVKTCERELKYADSQKKKIIFVLFEHFHSKEEKNEKLKAINWYLLDHKYYRYDRIDDLINAITILLKVIKILH